MIEKLEDLKYFCFPPYVLGRENGKVEAWKVRGLKWTKAKLEDWNEVWWNIEDRFCILALKILCPMENFPYHIATNIGFRVSIGESFFFGWERELVSQLRIWVGRLIWVIYSYVFTIIFLKKNYYYY